MNALTEQDADRLLEGVARIAEPLTLSSLREESILVVHSLIPSVSASWNEINATGNIDAVSVPEVVRWPGMDEAFARALAGHPVIAHIRKTNDGRPRAISDFWSIDQFHASTLYRELYQKLSTEDQLSFTVPTPDVLIGVAINRDHVGFSTRERTIANLLRPHILQAYRNAVANEQIGRLMSIVDDLTSDHEAGLVVLSGAGIARRAHAGRGRLALPLVPRPARERPAPTGRRLAPQPRHGGSPPADLAAGLRRGWAPAGGAQAPGGAARATGTSSTSPSIRPVVPVRTSRASACPAARPRWSAWPRAGGAMRRSPGISA